MLSHILFINYRRDDTHLAAKRLFEDLETTFGPGVVYRDEQSIPPGVIWSENLRQKLEKSAAVFVLIGSEWEHLRDSNGRRRIDSPDDWVRIEIETALAENKRIFPIFINRAILKETDYPESIRAIHSYQAITLYDSTWEAGLNVLKAQLHDLYNWTLRRASKKHYEFEASLGKFKNLSITDTLLPDIKSETKIEIGKEWLDTSVEMGGEKLPLYIAVKGLWKESGRHGLLIGEGGMGKTASLVRLWEELLNEPEGPVPLFLSLERFNAMPSENFIVDTLIRDYLGEEPTNISREKIKNLWHRPSHLDQPSIVLLLDGLNEISLSTQIPEQLKSQFEYLFQAHQALQIVITSRYPTLGYDTDSFTNLYLSPLSIATIDEYLAHSNVQVPVDANIRNVFYNPLMLTLYTRTTLEGDRYRAHVQQYYKPKIETKGELLWNFSALNLGKQLQQWKNNPEQRGHATYLVRVFLPWLGYWMERKEIFTVSGNRGESNALKLLEKCIDQYTQAEVELLVGQQLSGKIIAANAEAMLVFAARHLKLLSEIFHQTTAYSEDNLSNRSLSFLHQEFRSFFAGVYVLNELMLFNQRCKDQPSKQRAKLIPQSLRDWKWNTIISRYIGETSAEYQNAPFVENNRWVKPKHETLVAYALNHLRGIFDAKRLGLAVVNLIAAIRAVREDFSGEDLSSLYLMGVKLDRMVFSHPNGENQFFATSFEKSKLDPLSLLPIKHFPLADERAGYEYPDCIINSLFYSEDGKKFTSGTRHERIEWDVLTGQALCRKSNPVLFQRIWQGNLVPETPLCFISPDQSYGVSVMSHRGSVNSINLNFYQANPIEKRFPQVGFVSIWNLKDCSIIQEYRTNLHGWYAATKDFREIVTVSEDETQLFLWETLTGKKLAEASIGIRVKPLCLHNNKLMIMDGNEDLLEINFVEQSIEKLSINSKEEFVIGYTPDGLHLITCNYENYQSKDITPQYFSPVILEYQGLRKKNYGELRFWNISTGEIKRRFKGHSSVVKKVDFYQSDLDKSMKIISGADDSSLIEWDFYTAEILQIYSAGNKMPVVSNVTHSIWDTVAASFNWGEIRLYHSKDMSQFAILKGDLQQPLRGAFSLDGKKYLAVDLNFNLKFTSTENTNPYKAEVWSTETGSLIKKLKGTSGQITIPLGKFNNSASKVAIWGDQIFASHIAVYDLITPSEDPILEQEVPKRISDLFFSPDDKFIILIDKVGEGYFFWDLQNNKVKWASFPERYEVYESNINEILLEDAPGLFLLLVDKQKNFLSWLIKAADFVDVKDQIAFSFNPIPVDLSILPEFPEYPSFLKIKHCFSTNNRETLVFIRTDSDRPRKITIYEYDVQLHTVQLRHQSEEDVIMALDGKPYFTERGLSYSFFGDIYKIVRFYTLPLHKYFIDIWDANHKAVTISLLIPDINFAGCKFSVIDVEGDKYKSNVLRIVEETGGVVPIEHHILNYPYTHKHEEMKKAMKNLNVLQKTLVFSILGLKKIVTFVEKSLNPEKRKKQLPEIEMIKGEVAAYMPSKIID